ncbi:hypothetical protein FBUS_01392 [Fasciolopsis buskii]|uniref:Uncharacterized protein n=1 Tax=Fasciolopsis buskii TaxID=27845 RepID=A0A8E0RMQ4_9TREM|nr:hypothetical protein FBUS_01392 [Fasciolopsis buski]
MEVPKVKSNGMPSCSHCELAGGVCYDSDNDGLSNGCQCPIDRSHLTLPDWNSAPTAGLCGRHHGRFDVYSLFIQLI